MMTRQGNRILVDGPMTFETVEALVTDVAVFDGDDLIVDLKGVTNADSSALSLLLEWMRRVRGSGKKLEFANVGANLRSLAELYGVVDLLPFAA
ncbi:MAG: STAS domain-containing protein [Betaproteobacteria bacterium]